MLEPGEEFDLPQGPLTVGLVLERNHFLDGHFGPGDRVDGRGHDAVGSFAQELQGVIPGANLINEGI